jgi:hypothetical protein
MYRAVYFHKTTRAAEVMLKLLFQRYKALIASNENVVPDAPKAFAAAFRSNTKMPLSEYLQLDDHSVSEFMKACRSVDDAKLKELAVGILDRRLYKAVDATHVDADDVREFENQAINLAGNDNIIPDTASDTPYKPYDPSGDKPNEQIYIENVEGKQSELSQLSLPIYQLRSKYSLIRFYFPGEFKDQLKTLLTNIIKKGS